MDLDQDALQRWVAENDMWLESGRRMIRRYLKLSGDGAPMSPVECRQALLAREGEVDVESLTKLCNWVEHMLDQSLERLLLESMGLRSGRQWRHLWSEILEWGDLTWEVIRRAEEADGDVSEYPFTKAVGGLVRPIALEARIVLEHSSWPPWVTGYPDSRLSEDLECDLARAEINPRFPYWLHAERAAVLGDASLVGRVCDALETKRQALKGARGQLLEKWLVEIPFTVSAAMSGDSDHFHEQLKAQTAAHHRFAKSTGPAAFPYLRWPIGGKAGAVLSIDFSGVAMCKLFPAVRPAHLGAFDSLPSADVLDS